MIKKFTLLTLWMLLFCSGMNAQIINPVKWIFDAKKIDGKTYELHITANLDNNWHIYAQEPAEGTETVFNFLANPLVKFDGKVKESGNLEKKYDPVMKSVLKYYSNQVNFIQKVKIRAAANTQVKGTVTYIACNDRKCIPPTELPFSIKVSGK